MTTIKILTIKYGESDFDMKMIIDFFKKIEALLKFSPNKIIQGLADSVVKAKFFNNYKYEKS